MKCMLLRPFFIDVSGPVSQGAPRRGRRSRNKPSLDPFGNFCSPFSKSPHQDESLEQREGVASSPVVKTSLARAVRISRM